jgi:DNA-binding response OmpR family regulator
MGKHVLVVDDEPELGELIAHGLKANGFECSLAVNGLDGLDKARRLHPDAVVLDIMLPDLDGFTVCEMLRRQPSTARIPVVMLTCLGGALSRMNGLSSGADDYLTKPFKMGDLVSSIRGVLQNRHDEAHAAQH